LLAVSGKVYSRNNNRKDVGEKYLYELIMLHTKGMERVTNEQYIVEFERLLKVVDRIPVIN